MKSENKYILKKGVEVLEKLHFKPENIMVTGSIALDILGLLPSDRISHDIDFIIKMDDQTWRCLKLLEAIYTDEDAVDDTFYKNRKNMVIFNACGIVFNIWKYNGGDWSTIKDAETDVYVAKVNHILKAKKEYARMKDYQDINEIAKNILSI